MPGDAKSSIPKKPAPTLYFIVAIKLAKGVVLLLAAAGIFSLVGKDLSDVFDQFLRWVHLDPEHRFFSNIGDWLDTVTPANMRNLANVTALRIVFARGRHGPGVPREMGHLAGDWRIGVFHPHRDFRTRPPPVGIDRPGTTHAGPSQNRTGHRAGIECVNRLVSVEKPATAVPAPLKHL
jgi:hypothetical protein